MLSCFERRVEKCGGETELTPAAGDESASTFSPLVSVVCRIEMSIQFTVNNFADEFYCFSTLHELVTKRKKILAFFSPASFRSFSVSASWVGSPRVPLRVRVFSLCCVQSYWSKQIKHWSSAWGGVSVTKVAKLKHLKVHGCRLKDG